MKVFERLFISDLHYPIKGNMVDNSHRQLFEMLGMFRGRGYLFKEIYLVGDICENWYISSASHFKKNPEDYKILFRSFEAILHPQGKKYYLVGNHDSRSPLLKLPHVIQQFLQQRNWLIREMVRDEQIVVAHGHQGEYGHLAWFLSVVFVRFLYFLGLFVPGLFSMLHNWHEKFSNFRSGKTHQHELKFYSRLSSRLEQQNRVMIVGHTHHFLSFTNLNIVNTGDWMDSRSLVIQNKEVLHGYVYNEGFLREKYQVTLPPKQTREKKKPQERQQEFSFSQEATTLPA